MPINSGMTPSMLGELLRAATPRLVGGAYTTPIPHKRAGAFAEWLRRNNVTDLDHPLSFYDYRGAFLAGVEPGTDGHYPDTFKQPGHPTFSVESKYATGKNAPMAGRWKGERFIPAKKRS